MSDETIEDKAAAFKMPKTFLGTQVLWYENGLPNAAPNILTVTRIYDRRIEGRFLSGARVVVCPHLTDPTLEINEHHREDGAWDFTESYKLAVQDANRMRQQIHTLQLDVEDLKKKLDTREAAKERMAKARAAIGKKQVPQEV